MAAYAPRLARAFERLSGKVAVAVGLLLAGWFAPSLPPIARIDLALDDARFAWLARHAPRAAADSIAVVAIDEGSLDALGVPQSLLLEPLARAIAAIATARPRAIGVDVILPDRSYPALAPGADIALVTTLLSVRRQLPIVIGTTARDDGMPRPVLPALLGAASAHGVAMFPLDADARIRRIDERLGAHGETVPTLVGELARSLGLPMAAGGLHYALGNGFDAIPLAQVLGWQAAGDTGALAGAFAGRIVLIGAVLPFEDRFVQPVPLARGRVDRDAPGVLLHAQALRTLEAGALVQPAELGLVLPLLALATLPWFMRRPLTRILVLVVVGGLLLALAALALRAGLDVPLAAALTTAVLAAALRSAIDAWRSRAERQRLAAQFGGYVPPAVLNAILAGRLDDESRRGRRELAFLFADLRDFVALSARHAPESVLALLNRYYEAVTPAIHANGGTIDNYRGDGVMAIFGAPNALANPSAAACATARDMLVRLAALNREFESEGLPSLRIGITLALSEAVVGNVGSRQRHTYTAIGDGANVAARLQDVAKAKGWPVVATQAIIAAAGERDWTPLGSVPIRGRDPVEVAGWRPE